MLFVSARWVRCKATSNLDVPLKPSSQRSLRQHEIKSVQVLAGWTMNHVKQRVAKDMSAASELVRA
jgi:hypothetical protein